MVNKTVGRGVGVRRSETNGTREGLTASSASNGSASPSAGIAVGFYGNGETSDGVHRATYSLRHANRTVAGVQDRVSSWLGSVPCVLEPSVRTWWCR